MTHYKIVKVHSKGTIIHEYWEDLHIFTYRVDSVYYGGSVQDFLEKNKLYRIPNFENLEEFNRRYAIYDFVL